MHPSGVLKNLQGVFNFSSFVFVSGRLGEVDFPFRVAPVATALVFAFGFGFVVALTFGTSLPFASTWMNFQLSPNLRLPVAWKLLHTPTAGKAAKAVELFAAESFRGVRGLQQRRRRHFAAAGALPSSYRVAYCRSLDGLLCKRNSNVSCENPGPLRRD